MVLTAEPPRHPTITVLKSAIITVISTCIFYGDNLSSLLLICAFRILLILLSPFDLIAYLYFCFLSLLFILNLGLSCFFVNFLDDFIYCASDISMWCCRLLLKCFISCIPHMGCATLSFSSKWKYFLFPLWRLIFPWFIWKCCLIFKYSYVF